MRVLVTGGAGYIGSHTVLALLNHGHSPVIVDDFSNSRREVIRRLEKLSGTEIEFHEFNVCDRGRLATLFEEENFEAIIHFAGFKSVSESASKPLMYYKNNLASLIAVAEYALSSNTSRPAKFIFSSSATVYGSPQSLPISEDAPTGIGITNPYGQTKFMGETILRDVARANRDFQAIALRYFNPIGAHPSGEIGEDPLGIPNNLLPFISHVASGRQPELKIFGSDFDTSDGTGVRDYVHVADIAEGHVAALGVQVSGFHALNLGTGVGTSVLELVSEFEKATNTKIPLRFVERRSGDVDSCYAEVTKAKKVLNWTATRSISMACEDAWKWQSQNPSGYLDT